MKFFIAILLALSSTETARLPSYLEQCSLSNFINLNTCLVKKARLGIKHFVKGDYQYDIPNMLPLKLENAIVLKNDKDLKFILRNVEVNGLNKTYVKDGRFNLFTLKGEMILGNPELNILGDYEIEGTLLRKPVYGNGHANITLVDGVYKYIPTISYRNADGNIYLQLLDQTLSYTTRRNIYKLENLLNDDVSKGRKMNELMNKNWQEVSQVLRYGANKAMGGFITQVLKSIVDNVPITEIFKP